MKELKRLTEAIVRRAEQGGKDKGWYELCRQGYLPVEIALYSDPVAWHSDIVYRVRNYAIRHDLPVPVSCVAKRERTRKAPPEDWRAAFRSTVMRTGLCLHLTQPMLEYLCSVADDVLWDRFQASSLARPNNTFTTACLEKRGLIQRKPPEHFEARRKSQDAREDAYDVLTEAGEAVVQLLRVVGVFVPADRAIKKGVKA